MFCKDAPRNFIGDMDKLYFKELFDATTQSPHMEEAKAMQISVLDSKNLRMYLEYPLTTTYLRGY